MGKSSKQTIGYRYHLGQHLVVCHGPIDSVSRLKVDDKEAWIGLFTSNGTLTINQRNLFGGDDREGGVSGNIDILFGGATQSQNSYLANVVSPLVPAYRGVVSFIFKRFYFGNNPYLKSWAFRATRINKSSGGQAQWYPENATIQVNSPNPSVTAVYNLNDTFVYYNEAHPFYPTAGSNHPNSLTIGPFTKWHVIRAGVGGAKADDRFVFNGSIYGTVNFTNYPHGTEFYILPPGQSVKVEVRNNLNPECYATGKLEAVPFELTQWDMNAAHIIRECLTDPDWGMGYSEDDIDETSFSSSADTLFNEKLGLSLLWDRQKNIEDFVKDVVRHIDAALYVSRTSGKFVLKLIRNDYNEASLLVLDESNIAKVTNPNKPTFGELSNSVTVNFWNWRTGKDDSVSVTDTAMVRMQGQTIGTTIQYPGFTTRRNASLAAQRDLRSLSSSFLSCTIYANQDAKDLNIGDTFKFTWNKWNISNLVMRVTGIAFGDGKTNQIRVTCAQDVFSTPLVELAADPSEEWENPSKLPTVVPAQMASELPYYEIAQNIGQANIDGLLETNPDIGYVMSAASRPESAINGRIWTDAGSGYEEAGAFDFAPYCTLDSDISPIQTVVSVANPSDLEEVTVGSFVQLGSGNSTMEICRVDAIDLLTPSVTLGRGCLDTTPKIHLEGSEMFFWDLFSGYDPTEYVQGETIGVKVTAITGQGQLDVNLATEHNVTLDQRAYRPYAPGQFQINAAYYPEGPLEGLLTFTWADRDRLQQTSGDIYDHTFGDIGPEAGTTYRVRGYVDDVLVHTEEPAVSGATWTPPSDGLVKVEIDSKRDGVYSLQAASHAFYYTSTSIRLTEESDSIRTTESKDNHMRLTENL